MHGQQQRIGHAVQLGRGGARLHPLRRQVQVIHRAQDVIDIARLQQLAAGGQPAGDLGRARLASPRGERRLAVRATGDLAQATLMTTFPEIGTADHAAAFRRVAERVRLTRYGLDCYAYALLAAGHVDLVIEAGLQAYDVQAPIAVIEAAGGIVTDWQGRPAPEGGRIIAAASPALHAEALQLLNG